MLMENFGVTNKEHYRMLWYFLEWSMAICLVALKAINDLKYRETMGKRESNFFLWSNQKVI